jgi:16S rRNA (adenine1518-N6/adenine1519-N6)-dimethyltransferase
MFKPPRKRFGQNFLQDQNVVNKILLAIRAQADDILVEIGPGRGALTLPLLQQVSEMHVVEIDRDLIAWWESQSLPNLQLHAADALKFDFNQIKPGKLLRVIGNLPYNISTPLLFHLFDYIDHIKDMHFMLQKEVVERMTATPGGKEYGRLSIMVQYYCQADRLFIVPPGAFYPAPKVDSAIVRLQPRKDRPQCDPLKLAQVVQQAFSQRRKTLRNCLKTLVASEAMQQIGVDPTARPETLSLEDFVALSRLVADE